jgi:hypothetical protein
MKSLLLHPQKSLWLCFLTFLSITVYSQTNTFKAVADTIDLYPGVPRVYDILANDTIQPTDTIRVLSCGATHVYCTSKHDSTWAWTFTFTAHDWGYGGECSGFYFIATSPQEKSQADIIFRIHDNSYGYLNINNVNARFSASGSHFYCDSAQYEVPKGSGKATIFVNALWIGGKDSLNQLHLAAERFRQGSGWPAGTRPDFYAGPVMDSIHYSIYQDTVWNYVWNLKKTDIDYHRAHCWEAGYTPIHDILTWPGNGDVSLGQAQKLAPFSDRNGDGIYDPFDGDYPEIRGDQALFFIFNDDRGSHLETGGLKLGVEIHGMAYAFDMPDDSAFKNTVFLNYKLYNRSKNTYDSTLLGIFTDIDLGYANDDYVLCDVERNMFIGYNGTPVDGTGQSNAYGDSPPAQAVTILGGPYMDADGIDNPRFDNSGNQLCDFSVNGMNFGDSIVDNERYGLQRFISTNNSSSGVPSYMQDPVNAPQYYALMSTNWILYGGGSNPYGGYGPACRFMFPGESDTLNWGVGCVPPNGPKNWTEETAGNNPYDRRGVEVTGPITFHPGDVQELDLMFNWARAYGAHSPMASVEKLRQVADRISSAFAANQLPGGDLFYGIGDSGKKAEKTVKIYPNPASDQITILSGSKTTGSIRFVDILTVEGHVVKHLCMTGNLNEVSVNISDLAAGLYFVRVSTNETQQVKKLVVR